MASDAAFEKYMSVLQTFYGTTVILDGGFIEEIYFKALEKLSDAELEKAIATCIKKKSRQYGYFPSAEQLLEYAGYDDRPPGECSQKPDYNLPTLASSEMKTEGMSPDQRAVMVQCLRLAAEKHSRGELRDRRGHFASTAEILDPSLRRASLLEEMRKYLNSVDELRQRAIDWASDPENGCELVRDGNGWIIDIRELDF